MVDLTAQEYDAGIAAAKQAINENVPGWQRKMIPDDAVSALVASIVAAVDNVRSNFAAAQHINTPHEMRTAPAPVAAPVEEVEHVELPVEEPTQGT